MPAGQSLASLQKEIERLRARLAAERASRQITSTMVAQTDKRFRLGIFVTPLVILGGQVQGSVVWSSPMPTDVYKVDAACSAIPASMPSYTITNQTAAGCTITFAAPILLAAGTIVIVLGISAQSS